MEIMLQDILLRIEQSDDYEITEIMDAVRKRYAVRFPEWEVLFISCPKNDPITRRQTMEFILRHFQNT